MAPQTSWQYYYNLNDLWLKAGTRAAFLDKYYWEMQHPTFARNGELYIAAPDLQTIYSPMMELSESGGSIAIRYMGKTLQCGVNSETAAVDGTEVTLPQPPVRENAVTYLPISHLMSVAFGKHIGHIDHLSMGGYMGICASRSTVASQEWQRMDLVIGGKDRGDLYGTFWFEPGRKIVPYRVYVPYEYSPEKPIPMAVTLHGGNGDENWIFEKSGNQLQYLAKKENILIFSINGFCKSSFFGSLCPTASTIHRIDPTAVDPGNPGGLSEDAVAIRQLSERACQQALNIAFDTYAIDRERVYLFGNSMGGLGVYHFALINPGVFCALAPCGGSVNPNLFPVEKLGDVPIRLLFGSEDENGTHFLQEAHRLFVERGANASYHVIGGGIHSTAWVTGLPDIFSFFREVSGQR